MGGADHLVVGPPVAVEGVRLAPAAPVQGAKVLRDLGLGEEPSGADQRLGNRIVQTVA